MNSLSSFSQWTLALLPRLLSPGVLYLLAAAVLFYAANFKGHATPRLLLKALTQESVLALSLSWVAVALVPFADLAPLPFPVDVIALLALPVASLALVATQEAENRSQVAGSVTITLAVLITSLPGKSLLPAANLDAATWSALCGGLLALLGITPAIKASISGAMRWLALGSIVLIPLYSKVPSSQWTALYLLALLAGVGLLLQRLRWTAGVLYLAWIVVVVTLVIALLQRS